MGFVLVALDVAPLGPRLQSCMILLFHALVAYKLSWGNPFLNSTVIITFIVFVQGPPIQGTYCDIQD